MTKKVIKKSKPVIDVRAKLRAQIENIVLRVGINSDNPTDATNEIMDLMFEDNIEVNQHFYAVTDPQWGSPAVIPETIRSSASAAQDAVLWLSEHSIYHGGMKYGGVGGLCGIKGHWKGLDTQGYKVVEFIGREVQTNQSVGTHDNMEET